jgi:hypothetical protein
MVKASGNDDPIPRPKKNIQIQVNVVGISKIPERPIRLDAAMRKTRNLCEVKRAERIGTTSPVGTPSRIIAEVMAPAVVADIPASRRIEGNQPARDWKLVD